MGAWGYNALDNDPAQDVLYRWDEWVVKSSYTHEQATDQFIQSWGDAINYGDSITNMEIIALIAIYLNNDLEISIRLKKVAIDALNRELAEEALSQWEHPSKRKEALESLLKSVGGQVKKPRKPKVFRDPALCYSSASSAKKSLIKLRGRMKTAKPGYYRVNSEPAFMQTLRRLLNSQVWEKDYQIYEQAHRERLMMLVFVLSTKLKLSDKEFKELIEKCEKWPAP